MTDIRRHHAGTRLNLLDRIHIEVRKCRATHLRIGRVSGIEREHCCCASLSVHCELLSKIGRTVCIRHGPGRQQQQLAEVARIEG